MALEIIHDLSSLRDSKDAEQLDWAKIKAYLSEVSDFIGLDPALNALDTIWMKNENGPGQALVVYARRGTAEILRERHGIEVDSLTSQQVGGSIVYTATGHNSSGRHEIAIGAKSIDGLTGKPLDDAIMTASTRALRRLTMQFTKLGILDESEVTAVVGQNPSTAGSAQLAPNPLPPFMLPTEKANNAPGKDTTEVKQFLGQPEQVAEAWKQVDEKAAKEAAKKNAEAAVSPAPAATSEPEKVAEEVAKPKRRKKANTVTLDVEPETIQETKPEKIQKEVVSSTPVPAPEPLKPATVENQLPPQAQQPAALAEGIPAAGMPTADQLTEFRKKIGAFTAELTPSENLGSVQKMRAFITKLSGGTAPQNMTLDQWQEVIGFFDGFMERNSGNVKNLVKYINDMLGVK